MFIIINYAGYSGNNKRSAKNKYDLTDYGGFSRLIVKKINFFKEPDIF